MNREVFEKRYMDASIRVDAGRLLRAQMSTIDKDPIDIGCGTRNIIMAIEELSELQKELSKFLRGKGDHLCIVEEVADVIMCINLIAIICSITDEEINKAINVKIDRLENTDGVYR